jgi:protein-arginine deiminase
VRVFADVEHTGQLAGPLAGAPKAFVIVAPMPPKCADLERLPASDKDREDISQRLGRLRVEADDCDRITLAWTGAPAGSLRLYRKSDDGWQRTTLDQVATWTIPVDKSGVVDLGVGVALPEGKDSAATAWPRAFTVEVAGKAGSTVRVPFRVAPFLIPSSLDPVEELMIVAQAATTESVKALEALSAKTGLKLRVHTSKPDSDQWMQDTIEPGVFAYPAVGQVVQVRAVLTGLRQWFWKASAGLDREIAGRLRDDGVVTVVPGAARKGTRWIDWYGNLEVTPPHTDRGGKRFPYGRVLTGRQKDLGMHPGVLAFLEAQAAQWPPIVVDTSWLLIGHVDEVVNFVPAKTPAGFKVLLPSPMAARRLLDALVAQGLGDLPVFEKSRDETTVTKLRDGIAVSAENRAIDETVAGIRKQLQSELNLAESDFVLLPVLFARRGAVIPNAVNGVVVNGHYLASEPRGPRKDGQDFFEAAIREALAGCDVRVHFIDGWRAYHEWGGEVHCGTNTFRRLRDPVWWRHGGIGGAAK